MKNACKTYEKNLAGEKKKLTKKSKNQQQISLCTAHYRKF